MRGSRRSCDFDDRAASGISWKRPGETSWRDEFRDAEIFRTPSSWLYSFDFHAGSRRSRRQACGASFRAGLSRRSAFCSSVFALVLALISLDGKFISSLKHSWCKQCLPAGFGLVGA